MSEMLFAEAEISLLRDLPAAPRRQPILPLRAGRILGKLVLVGLLLTYLVGWVQDLQRVHQLEAEPTPPAKVITKYEAWQRIYQRPAR